MDTRAELVVTGTIGGGSAALGADILRGFDRLRRRLAREQFGSEGVGIGYHLLEIDLDALGRVPRQATIALTAMRIGTRASAHEVEYIASALPDECEATGTARSCPLARARGWTQVPTSIVRDAQEAEQGGTR